MKLKLKLKIIHAFLLSFTLSAGGCSLSAHNQERLDEFPECEIETIRFNNRLSPEESNCITRGQMKARRDNEINERRLENLEYKKTREKIEADYKKETSEYLKSKQGEIDRVTCNNLIKQSLVNISYTRIESLSFSRSDGYLTCSSLVHYQAFHGMEARPITVIYNEKNKMMKVLSR
ncbi:hypothetical protein ACE02G_17195 [Shewanella xiamenensis]|uniref:hypothetical protein n=1 Tax=Shewanella xiamenensis TaxID=332186 RepID=UPI001559201B|nr:hypothetical protein [Shewanella xiamenensis]